MTTRSIRDFIREHPEEGVRPQFEKTMAAIIATEFAASSVRPTDHAIRGELAFMRKRLPKAFFVPEAIAAAQERRQTTASKPDHVWVVIKWIEVHPGAGVRPEWTYDIASLVAHELASSSIAFTDSNIEGSIELLRNRWPRAFFRPEELRNNAALGYNPPELGKMTKRPKAKFKSLAEFLARRGPHD